jgi:hypothetical protein
MKKIGIILFLLANSFLLYYYVKDIMSFITHEFDHDLIRYVIYFAVADSLFIISLLFLLKSFGLRKFFILPLLLSFVHNILVVLRGASLPFTGAFIVLVSFIFIVYNLNIYWVQNFKE